MRELTLVIPGLLWPAESAAAVSRDLALPALGALLATDAIARRPARPLEYLLADEWKLDPLTAPYAALRLLGGGRDPGSDCWICADPGHLRFARESLVFADNRELMVSADEAAQIVAALNETFADVGSFSFAAAGEWHLRLPCAPDIATHPISQVVGRNIETWLPAGPDAKTWRRTINEIQMALHGHGVNATRETAGRPTINTLWLWGQGRLQPGITHVFDTVLANNSLARGLASAGGARADVLPRRFAPPDAANTLILIDHLDYALLSHNDAAWRAALMEVEADWLAPALRAFRTGELSGLRLVLPGDQVCLDLACTRPAWWRFWRQPELLDAFILRHASP